ncbi:MLO-like protein 12 [Orobanche gracilis]
MLLESWFKKKHKKALYEALEKVKGELMLLGFLSLLLTVLQDPISKICISKNVASTWHPCSTPKISKTEDHSDSDSDDTNSGKLLQYLDPMPRRVLATKGYDKCAEKGGKLLLFLHQLHIFIFMLAIFHILQCIITLALGRIKMRRGKKWEDETRTIECISTTMIYKLLMILLSWVPGGS